MSVRIDRWLWAARFFKTRGLATDMVNGGHIKLNGDNIKASKQVQVGDTLSIVRNHEQYVVTVTGLAEKRGSATVAQTLYAETTESMQQREELKLLRKLTAPPAPEKRPDKKARGKIIRFKRREG
ncbi:MAG: RNA-binding S4 domain-containing protein [Mariprofundus sp.]